MHFGTVRGMMTLAVLGLAAMAGCEKKQASRSPEGNSEQAKAPASQPLVPAAQMIDWCREHGVPESACTQCNQSLVAGFKAKGDWCKEHSFPESQCFKCHPELKEKFAAAYTQKYGKVPPAPLEAKN